MRLSRRDIFWGTFILALIAIPIAVAIPADPGHSASAIGPGTFEPGTYTFPSGSSICLGGVCASEWPSGGGNFVNKTVATYTGSFSYSGLTGYKAANAICNASFPGSFMCNQADMMTTIKDKNISEIADWTGAAWVNAGGPKYVPAQYPANDCSGWTSASANVIGNYWLFSQDTGGLGAAINCDTALSIACCS